MEASPSWMGCWGEWWCSSTSPAMRRPGSWSTRSYPAPRVRMMRKKHKLTKRVLITTNNIWFKDRMTILHNKDIFFYILYFIYLFITSFTRRSSVLEFWLFSFCKISCAVLVYINRRNLSIIYVAASFIWKFLLFYFSDKIVS